MARNFLEGPNMPSFRLTCSVALLTAFAAPALASDVCKRFQEFRAQVEVGETLVQKCEAAVKLGADYGKDCERFLRYKASIDANREELDSAAGQLSNDLADGYALLATDCGLNEQDLRQIGRHLRNIAHSSRVIADLISVQ
jgi:hypothetical protein